MQQVACTTLWLTDLALPILLFVVANPFNRTWHTVVRAALAIGCGWAFSLSYAIAANAINVCFAQTQAQLLAIYDTDGAPLAFAAVLGWLFPAITVFATWGIRSAIIRRAS